MQTRANHAQTFRHTPTSVKPLNEAKVAALLDQEWARYKETTKQSGLENNQAKKQKTRTLQRRLSETSSPNQSYRITLLDMRRTRKTKRPMDSRPHQSNRPEQSPTPSASFMQLSTRKHTHPINVGSAKPTHTPITP